MVSEQEHKAVVRRIKSITLSAAGEGALLELDDTSSYWIPKDDQAYAARIEVLQERQISSGQVYIEYSSADRIVRAVHLPVERRILAMSPSPEGGGLSVFTTSPSVYTLRLSHPDYPSFYRTLAESVETGASVLMTTRPRTLEILDVRA